MGDSAWQRGLNRCRHRAPLRGSNPARVEDGNEGEERELPSHRSVGTLAGMTTPRVRYVPPHIDLHGANPMWAGLIDSRRSERRAKRGAYPLPAGNCVEALLEVDELEVLLRLWNVLHGGDCPLHLLPSTLELLCRPAGVVGLERRRWGRAGIERSMVMVWRWLAAYPDPDLAARRPNQPKWAEVHTHPKRPPLGQVQSTTSRALLRGIPGTLAMHRHGNKGSPWVAAEGLPGEDCDGAAGM